MKKPDKKEQLVMKRELSDIKSSKVMKGENNEQINTVLF